MKLPNGYGSVTKMSGKRRNPWVVRKTDGYILDPEKGTKKQNYIIIGYALKYVSATKIILHMSMLQNIRIVIQTNLTATNSAKKKLNVYGPCRRIPIIRLFWCFSTTAAVSANFWILRKKMSIWKIVGHSGAMTLTERVYKHLDVRILIDAVNKIVEDRENGEEGI